MLSSLIVLGTMLGSVRSDNAQSPQFPKPDLNPPAALQDSTIFKYLSTEDKQKQWSPLEVGRDWSNIQVPALKPDAIKLKVLLAVAERDFSDPEYSNTLESRDKSRILEAVGRLKSLFAVVSDGGINLQIVPRFVPEPIFDINEFKQLINAEFNRSKFESDDSVERGPFAAIIALSSSHVSDKALSGDDFAVHGFSDIGGSSPDMWFEEGLFYLAQSGIFSRISNHYSGFKAGFTTQNTSTFLFDRMGTIRGEYQRLFDPNYRQDGELVSKWAQQTLREMGRAFRGPQMASIQAPAAISVVDGVLNYSELSILRAGEFALPLSSKLDTEKTLKFEIRTKGKNPFAVKVWGKDGKKSEWVLGSEPGMLPISADGNWQSISIGLPADGATGVTIGAPASYFGKSRMRAELTQCDFRNFELVPTLAVAAVLEPPKLDLNPEQAIRQALATGNRVTKRKALAQLDVIRASKGLEADLLNATNEIDAGVSHDATKAYFELVLTGQPNADQLANMARFLVAPPSEAVREVALAYIPKNTTYASFNAVTACTVRENWRVRRSAMIALGALYRAGIKEKEGCHQNLLLATSQEMGLLRLGAVMQLDPTQTSDSQRLEFLMVNDPCESVRIASFQVLATNSSIPKQKLLGCLADDSPTLRERIPSTLGSKSPLLREVLQKLVVDQDPYVRVSALQNFSALGEVKEGEIQNVFSDKHPAVQFAVLQGAAKGSWKIPADALAKLKESPISLIREMAMELK